MIDHGLLCKNEMERVGIRCENVAYPRIQERRAVSVVPFGPQGTVHDYVPFYFCPRPPMLGAIHCGNVEGVTCGQSAILHLVSTVQAVTDEGIGFVFTDGHAAMRITNFFDDVDDLQRIDWDMINSRYWQDTQEDGDRMRRKQAEFLVHRSVRWDLVREIGVFDRRIRDRVCELLEGAEHQPSVVIQPSWYYN